MKIIRKYRLEEVVPISSVRPETLEKLTTTWREWQREGRRRTAVTLVTVSGFNANVISSAVLSDEEAGSNGPAASLEFPRKPLTQNILFNN